MLALQEQFGRRFEYVGGQLQESNLTAAEIRSKAWMRALEMVEDAPRAAQVQIFSQAANIAERNRVNGYLRQMLVVLERMIAKDPASMTSFGYAIAADLTRRDGADGWADVYWAFATKAVEGLAVDSPSINWFSAAIRSLVNSSNGIGQRDRMIDLLAKANISAESIARALSSN